jgi:hypothetical protein
LNRAASQPETPQPSAPDQRGLIFAAVAGFFFFIALLKFGNPVILDSEVVVPHTFFEWLYQPWPVRWGYRWGFSCLGAVALLELIRINWAIAFSPQRNTGIRKPDLSLATMPKWLKAAAALPGLWFLWQCVCANYTVDATLTFTTLKHFAACIACFYLGFFVLGRVKNPWPVWLFLSLALLWIVREGWNQHFGGLEETRKYFYSMPNWKSAPPEFIKKLSSNRIYSTLFYPNTLAGALLLLVPITLGLLWQITAKLRDRARWLIIVLVAIPALACLYWSQSKAGWLIALVLILVALLQSNLPKRTKLTILVMVVVGGLAGFGFRYAQFFQRGSTSVVARFDYWRAALIIGKEHPLLGTGPGTFAKGYAKIKSPEAEMSRLVHNDYLEQFCDSGIPGFLLFVAFILAVLVALYRYRNKISLPCGIGVLGILLHSSVEFHLYIPAIGWPTFFLIGWLLARAISEKQPILVSYR